MEIQMESPQSRRETGKQSPELLETWLAKVMDRALSNYPNQEISESTAVVWRQIWRELVEEFGWDVFYNALWRLCKTSEWFPSPATIRKEIEGEKPKFEPDYFREFPRLEA